MSPVIPIAEEAIATGSTERVAAYLAGVLQDELSTRLEQVYALAADQDRSVADARHYVEAMLGFQVDCHSVLKALQAHGTHHGGEWTSIAPAFLDALIGILVVSRVIASLDNRAAPDRR